MRSRSMSVPLALLAVFALVGSAASARADDCNSNEIDDACDIDCGAPGGPCDVSGCGQSEDCNANGVPDECEPDFDADGLIDACDSDIDADGVDNANDVCVYTPLGAQVDGQGRGLGDIDKDCDTDLDDYGRLQGGFAGDLGEYTQFQGGFTGPVWPPRGPMLLVPGGEFEMGRHSGIGAANELPVHAVYVDSFYVDLYEATNQEYGDYLNAAHAQGLVEVSSGIVYKAGGVEPYCDTAATPFGSRITWDGSTFGVAAGKEDHPVVLVSWYGAVAFCNWRSEMHGRQAFYDLSTWTCDFSKNGYRLLTEAEWEYAARGGLHSPYYIFPWGDEVDGSQANYWFSGDVYEIGPEPWTTPVGYYDGGQAPPGIDMANGYGLYDMAGGVYEWCNDWFDDAYYSSSPYDNPQGPATGTYRVLRGGTWGS